jgi:exonuclease SbcD
MRTRFIHAADIHLGYEQYNLTKRANDFARAFVDMVAHAVDHKVSFVLLAGDLFHRSSADAWMLKQATAGLQMLRDAGIPVIAVEGNHDAQHARKQLSWMEFLCDQELLILLNVQTAENGYKALVPWDPKERRGSWIDVAGVRVYGIKYYGAMMGRVLEQVGGDIEAGPGGYTVLMLHAGMQGQVPHMHGGLTFGQVAPLHPPVDYLALGHVHKRLNGDDGWIFNPGSTEINSMEEIEWAHGFFDVQVDTERPVMTQVTEVATPNLRAFHRISVTADDAASLEDFIAATEARIASARGISEGAVIELQLGGVAQFRRQEVPVERLRGAVEMRFSPLVVRVLNQIVPPGLVSVRHGERMQRRDLEQDIVQKLVYQNGAYRDRAAGWTPVILDVKNMAAEKQEPAAIVEYIEKRQAEMRDEPVSAVDEESVVSPSIEPPDPEWTESALALGGESPCSAPLFEDY